ncbi:hypothetical protein THIOSC15_2100003 [uncultured Thiomicrorhabdus sp.]
MLLIGKTSTSTTLSLRKFNHELIKRQIFHPSTNLHDWGKRTVLPVYGYETHNDIYDVLVVDKARYVRKNTGQWSNLIDAWEPIHYAIEQHFKLSEKD